MSFPNRPIKRLLIANRGEIATRILSTARELDIETYTLYTTNDSSYTPYSTHSIFLPSPSSYLNIPELISVVQKYKIDAIHPGYGFLSESPEFSSRMWNEAKAIVIGPGPEILSKTADKLQARLLAQMCFVPVLPALESPTDDITLLQDFASDVGYPIVIKAVDGGGGRGIRIVRNEEDLASMMKAALRESPSGMAFAEKAAIDGYRHVEVQIVGDGKEVRHLWERECSVQRRFQKIVEFAPCSIGDRELIGEVIDAAVRMAREVNYSSLGTFEFLVKESPPEFYFLEVNPRIQVEHTITESLAHGIDLIKIQLLLAQGESLSSLLPSESPSPPPIHSLQLRITAEDTTNNFSLSVGKISSFNFPCGNGIRIDTHLHPSKPTIIGTDFDSLLAKIIITAPTWPDVISKAKRALEDTYMNGIATNIELLRAIICDDDFVSQKCDIQWLESNLSSLLEAGKRISEKLPKPPSTSASSSTLLSSSNVIFRPNDAWDILLTPISSHKGNSKKQAIQPTPHHLKITRIHNNNFPHTLNASILLSSPSSNYKPQAPHPQPYNLSLTSTTSSTHSSISALTHRQGNPHNPLQITIPFPCKLVEINVQIGDEVRAGQTICVVRQMKMEVEIRCKVGGRVVWVFEDGEGEGEEGEVWEWDVGMGVLVCELEELEGGEKGRGGGSKL